MVFPDETSAIEPHEPLLMAIERAALGLAGRRTARGRAWLTTDAVVAVQYRGAWFFIDDRDIDSKDTFRLLDQVGSILAGETAPSPAPVLTLPMGGG